MSAAVKFDVRDTGPLNWTDRRERTFQIFRSGGRVWEARDHITKRDTEFQEMEKDCGERYLTMRNETFLMGVMLAYYKSIGEV